MWNLVMTAYVVSVYLAVFVATVLFPSETRGQHEPQQSIVVTTNHDIQDGEIRSISALIQSPGKDEAVSLREAIEAANRTPGTTGIRFNLSTQARKFVLSRPLPPITAPIVLDGGISSDDGEQAMVELVWENTEPSPGPRAHGVVLNTNDSRVENVTLKRFPGHGIVVNGDNNYVMGCFIGTDVNGTPAVGNQQNGIFITGSHNQIGGAEQTAHNMVSGNGASGIAIKSGSHNRILGNLIGTHPRNGRMALSNGQNGVHIWSDENVIGGANPGEGNVISGNGRYGIRLDSGNSTRIQGNLIGTDVSAHDPLPNAQDGVFIQSNTNIIGGTQTGQGNIIGSNGQSGIEIHDGTMNVIQGNSIGTDRKGTIDLGNTLEGIVVLANTTQIGGTLAEQGNRIAFNRKDGIAIVFGQGNTIRGNRIYRNQGLAINLQQDSVTANDPLDSDLGPNDLQNYPTLEQVLVRDGSHLIVRGEMHGRPMTTFYLDMFSSQHDELPRLQEAYAWLGSTTVRTDTQGNGRFQFTSDQSVPPGVFITSTATDPQGNTSELAESVAVISANPTIVWSANNATRNVVNNEYTTTFGKTGTVVGLVPPTVEIRKGLSSELTRLTVTVTNPLDGHHERVMPQTTDTSLTVHDKAGILTITGRAPIAIYQRVLRSLAYDNDADNPTPRPRVITLTVSDGEFTSPAVTTRVQMRKPTPNTPPRLIWPDAPHPYVSTYRTGTEAAPLAPAEIEIHDTDSERLTQLTITPIEPLNRDHEQVTAHIDGTSLEMSDQAGTLTITGSEPLAAYQRVLRSLSYRNDVPGETTSREFTVMVRDEQGSTSEPMTMGITFDRPTFAPPFIESLDTFVHDAEQAEIQQREEYQLVAKTITGSSMIVTTGLVIWILRGTALLTSLLATIPVWSSFDPLPFLNVNQYERERALRRTQKSEAQEDRQFPLLKKMFSSDSSPDERPPS